MSDGWTSALKCVNPQSGWEILINPARSVAVDENRQQIGKKLLTESVIGPLGKPNIYSSKNIAIGKFEKNLQASASFG